MLNSEGWDAGREIVDAEDTRSLRLRFGQGLSQRAIGQSLRLSVGAANGYLSRSRMAGQGWPLPAEFDDAQLETLLYPPPRAVASERRPAPDWAVVHRELRRPNVTLALLWEEYRTGPGAQDGFGYCLVLRSLSGVGLPVEADAAPGAHGGGSKFTSTSPVTRWR